VLATRVQCRNVQCRNALGRCYMGVVDRVHRHYVVPRLLSAALAQVLVAAPAAAMLDPARH
jgi:hypothetical protein